MFLFGKRGKKRDEEEGRGPGVTRSETEVCERCGVDLRLIDEKKIAEVNGKRYCDVCAEAIGKASSVPKKACAACRGEFPASEMRSVYGKTVCADCFRKYMAGKLPELSPLMPETSHGQARKKNGGGGPAALAEKAEELLDDASYVGDMKHTRGAWQQYDFLLAARAYGWRTMVDWASYMESADLDAVSTLTVAEMANTPEIELIREYKARPGKIEAFDKLASEKGRLAIGGISRTLKAPVKIVWFNQTRVLRFFTPVDDDTLLLKYAETVIRRTFGTKDAMKLAKPVQKPDEVS